MPAQYGLIGYPLTHSFSPAYFKRKFAVEGINAEYANCPIPDIMQFPALLKDNPRLRGLSVTIPYKESVMAWIDEIDSAATEVGAVNSISINNGHTKGYNTDIIGFELSLTPLLLPQHTNALILGTGGAAKAVAYVLRKLGVGYKFVSRNKGTGSLTYDQLTQDTVAAHLLIVNTTPVGMYPGINAAPALPYKHLGPEHILYDLVYNPEETIFLSLGKSRGATVKNGLEMLHLQADASWNIWNGK